MTSKLHVRNLCATVTDQELRKRFEPFGVVEFAAIFSDETSAINRRFGLVEMADSAGADKAIEWLNFSTHEGLVMSVGYFNDQNLAQ